VEQPLINTSRNPKNTGLFSANELIINKSGSNRSKFDRKQKSKRNQPDQRKRLRERLKLRRDRPWGERERERERERDVMKDTKVR